MLIFISVIKNTKLHEQLQFNWSKYNFVLTQAFEATNKLCHTWKLEFVFILWSAASMSSETISLGQLSPDSCQSCSKHTCGVADSPLASSPRRSVPVIHEVPVYEIDNGTHSRTCMRKILIASIVILLCLILVVIILRSIF